MDSLSERIHLHKGEILPNIVGATAYDWNGFNNDIGTHVLNQSMIKKHPGRHIKKQPTLYLYCLVHRL